VRFALQLVAAVLLGVAVMLAPLTLTFEVAGEAPPPLKPREGVEKAYKALPKAFGEPAVKPPEGVTVPKPEGPSPALLLVLGLIPALIVFMVAKRRVEK
jgi:hypothetical protein